MRDGWRGLATGFKCQNAAVTHAQSGPPRYNLVFPQKRCWRQTSMSIPGITDPGYFCLAVLLLNATPGPDTAFIVSRSVVQGRAAGLVAALGISAGCCLHALACAFGLSALLAASGTAFLVVKLAGGMYLMYLGIRMLLATPATAGVPAKSATRQTRPLLRIFWQALMTNILNPKVVLFFLSFFPQFINPNAGNRTLSFLLLGIVFVLMSTGWNCTTAIVAATLTRTTEPKQRVRFWLERCIGIAFIALGARIALTRN